MCINSSEDNTGGAASSRHGAGAGHVEGSAGQRVEQNVPWTATKNPRGPQGVRDSEVERLRQVEVDREHLAPRRDRVAQCGRDGRQLDDAEHRHTEALGNIHGAAGGGDRTDGAADGLRELKKNISNLEKSHPGKLIRR